MAKYVFLYKENTENRDCCAYIEAEPFRWKCGHYFGSVKLHGACYSGHDFAEYENIKTILTKEEYNQLRDFGKELNSFGYGITKGDERYNKGVELCKAIQKVYDKLLSEENQILFEEIQQEETEYLMEEYGLYECDVEQIFNEYSLDYKDRAIVACVFNDTYDCGYEEAWSMDFINNNIMERYFDFEKFGEDLLEEESYMQLEDGRIVALNY